MQVPANNSDGKFYYLPIYIIIQIPTYLLSEPSIWTNKSTLLLISLLAEKKDDLRNSKKKKKDIWRSIKDEMVKHGLGGFDESTIERKFRNMKNTYKKICDNKKKTVTGRGTIKWEYFNAMQDIFADDKTINIDHTIASLPTSGSPMEPSSSILNIGSPTEPSSSILNIEAVSTPLSVETENETSSSISIPSPHEVTNLSKSPVTSWPSGGAKKEKAQRGKLLYGLRKKQLDIEAERVAELTLLRKAIEENNNIQRQRNELLQLYLEREK